MLDSVARRLIDPPLNHLGRKLAARGVGADTVTLAGLALGLVAAVLIALDLAHLALLPLLMGRLADGLDGAVARASALTEFGGLLDIVADFALYGAVPLAFVIADPAVNGAAGAFLLMSFYVNGATFLGFAAIAARRGMDSRAQGVKSLYYSAGLLEGTETIAFFTALCLWPASFAPLAWGFGLLCLATAVLRLLWARGVIGN